MKKPSYFTYEMYPYDVLCKYAGLDCIATSETMAKLMPVLAERPDYMFYVGGKRQKGRAMSMLQEQETVKSKALLFACNLEIAGLRYDVEGNRRMAEAMREDIRATQSRIFEAIGREIDLNSSQEVALFLYSREHCGFEVPIKTKTGEDSTSGDALNALFEKYKTPWLKDMKRYKDVSSLHNSFIKTYIGDFVKSDGRVHPQYNLHGTSSHRISSDKPNLLNLPKGWDYPEYNIRSLYGVTPGMIFLTFDFSSCEVKILAALSGDEAMIEACISGKDFHSYTASMIYHLDYDELVAALDDETKSHPRYKEFKNYRQWAKAVTFGLLYGKTVGSLAYDLGIERDEAQAIMNAYFEAFPKVKTFIEDCHNMAAANYYMVTPFGQRKREDGMRRCFQGTAAYTAARRNSQNVMIQSPASTLGLMVFAELDRRVREIGGRCICTVYDSIEIEVPLARAAEAIELGFYTMDDWPVEQFNWLTFPIGTDGEIGWNWGTLSKVHRGITQSEVEAILENMDPVMYAEAA